MATATTFPWLLASAHVVTHNVVRRSMFTVNRLKPDKGDTLSQLFFTWMEHLGETILLMNSLSTRYSTELSTGFGWNAQAIRRY